MTTTIGIGYRNIENEDLITALKPIADKFEYGLLCGIENSELDMRSGLEVAKVHQDWADVLILKSPPDGAGALAFDIVEELYLFELKNIKPRFFDFLVELSGIAGKKCSKLGIFFSAEWHADDRCRYSYGQIKRLIDLLSLPGNWSLRYLTPPSGRLQDSDETPLIFDVMLY